MIVGVLCFLLLPIAATSGWFMGRKESKEKPLPATRQLHHDYFRGLNYLIDEQPDKAVDVFVKLIEVDNDTVELHLALGHLFRRRGEVDRAIRIHQSLIARSQLEEAHRTQALIALGQDYLRAGVLDRAEKIFQGLLSKEGRTAELSLRFLLRIYEQEKDWQLAIETAKQLAELSPQSMRNIIPQYHCELAEQKAMRGEIESAFKELESAQKRNPNCIRANLIKARLALQLKRYPEAIYSCQQVIEKDSDFISEVVVTLCNSFQNLNEEKKLIDYLYECLKKFPRVSLILAVSNHLQRTEGNNKVAIDFVTEQIKREPSLLGLTHLAELYSINSRGDTKEKLLMLQNFMQQLLADKPKYRCLHCGFSVKILFWLCPSCHSWSTIKPILGLEGG